MTKTTRVIWQGGENSCRDGTLSPGCRARGRIRSAWPPQTPLPAPVAAAGAAAAWRRRCRRSGTGRLLHSAPRPTTVAAGTGAACLGGPHGRTARAAGALPRVGRVSNAVRVWCGTLRALHSVCTRRLSSEGGATLVLCTACLARPVVASVWILGFWDLWDFWMDVHPPRPAPARPPLLML